MLQFIQSEERKVLLKTLLPAVLVTLFSLVFFQLVLVQERDSALFASLHEGGGMQPSEFNGIAGIILVKLMAFIGEPAIVLRIVTAILSGLFAFVLARFLRCTRSTTLILCSVGFLALAAHSPLSMLTIVWAVSVLLALRRHQLPNAAVLAGVGFGVDQLLAVALGVYVIWFTATLRNDAKEVARNSALPLFGVGIWVLLAWMLFGAGLTEAILSGFNGLFTQLNPLNFALTLILTFNLLLIRLVGVKAHHSQLPYLGSMLIALFLFVRSEPQYILFLLVAGIAYLKEIDPQFPKGWMLPVYAAINLTLFFLLPATEPIAARYQPRAEQESEAATYLNSYFSEYMPSYAALREKDAKLEGGRKLVAATDRGSALVLDPITESWFTQSAIAAGNKDRFIGRYEPRKRIFRGNGRDTSLTLPVRGAKAVYFLGTEYTSATVTKDLRAMGKEDGLTLYAIDSSKLNQFFDAYIYHYFRSYH